MPWVVFRFSLQVFLYMLPLEAFFSSQIFLILRFRIERKTDFLLLTKVAMLTLREQQEFQVTQTCALYE